MPEENARLNVEISQTSKGTAIADAARDARKLAEAAGLSGKAAEENAKSVNDLGEATEKGAAAGRALSGALQGNVSSLLQLGPLLKGLAAIIKGSLIGALVTLGTVAAALVVPFVEGFKKKEEAANGAAEAIKEATRAAEELGKQRLESLRADLEAVREAAEGTLHELEASLAAAAALADAQDRLEDVRDAANNTLTEEQRVNRRAARAEAAAERRSARALTQAEGVVAARRSIRDDAGSQESSAAREFARVNDTLSALRRARGEAQAEVARILAARDEEFRRIEREVPAEISRQGARREASERARAEAAPAVARLGLLDSPEGLEREAGLAAARDAAAKRLTTANEAALRSAAELSAAERNLVRVREEQAKVGALEAEARAIQARTAREEAQAADEARRQAGDREVAGIDAVNTAARARDVLGGLSAPDPESAALIAKAGAAAARLAEAGADGGEVGADQTAALAAALRDLLAVVDARMPRVRVVNSPVLPPRRGTAATIDELAKEVRDAARRLETVESQLKTRRTR